MARRADGWSDGWVGKSGAWFCCTTVSPADRQILTVFAIWFFCFFILGRNRVESTDFHICLPPPPSLQAQVLARGGFVQAQVLAVAISCKRKRSHERFRASASACRGGFVQAQVLAGAISCKRKRLHEITPASPYACTRPPVLPLYKTGGLGPQDPLERRTQGSPHTGVAAPFRSYSPPPRPRPQLRKPCLQRAPSGKR